MKSSFLFTVYTHSHVQTAACVLCLVCALLGFLRVNDRKVYEIANYEECMHAVYLSSSILYNKMVQAH